jgi:MinD-like ATPase involved in chromosome partitioning or flagellar assembly
VLFFASPESQDLRDAYALAKHLLQSGRTTRIGLTIHGARRIGEAKDAFTRLAGTALRHLRHSVVSYGLLVDDLHVYRAIVARRPIGLEHPQSRAARALRDVARLLLDDARKPTLG